MIITDLQRKRIFLFYLVVYIVYLIFLTLSPFRFRPLALHHFPWPIGPSRFETFDLVANIFLFFPFGFLLVPLLHGVKTGPRWPKAIAISAAVSFTIESMQIITVGRYPAFGDILTNTIGGGIGCFIGTYFQQKRGLFFVGEDQLHRNVRTLFVGISIAYCGFLLYLSSFSGELFPHQNSNVTILIGNNPEKDNPWNGEIVSLAVYDKALSSHQVKQHYQNGSFQSEVTMRKESPLAFYSFQHQQDGSIPDQSTIPPPLHLAWLPAQRGSLFDGSSSLVSQGKGLKIVQQVRSTQQMTVEAWIKPQPQSPSGGRFFSFIEGNRSLFYIDQEVDEIVFGLRPSIFRRGRFHSEEIDLASPERRNVPLHLVGIYDQDKATLYLNGKNIAEGFMTNHFFILANRLNLDRAPFGGRGFLGLLLFWPLGLFLSLAINRFSIYRIVHNLAGFLFVGLILLIQAKNGTSFFTERTVLVPFLALILGVISGGPLKRHLSTLLLGQSQQRVQSHVK